MNNKLNFIITGATAAMLLLPMKTNEIHIKGREFAYTIDKRTALFTEMKFAGREYLNHPMELNIWRAPTDNDMYIKSECIRCGRDSTEDS